VRGIAEIAVIARDRRHRKTRAAIRVLCIKEVTRTLKPYWFKVSVFFSLLAFISDSLAPFASFAVNWFSDYGDDGDYAR
jgi:hypothetical protein